MVLNLAVMVSGRGSNLGAIAQSIVDKRLDARIKLVIINNDEAKGIDVCKKYSLNYEIIEHKNLKRQDHEAKVIEKLKSHELNLIVLAGYMRVLTKDFLNSFKLDNCDLYPVINIHPSLLPAFPGSNAYEEAFNYGVKVSGITVHLVDEKVDNGLIIDQACFYRDNNDSLDDFKAKGLKVEHELYPKVLQDINKNGIYYQHKTYYLNQYI